MGCCNKIKEDDRDYPKGVQPCCGGVRGKRCFCLPYNNPWMITAQILAIVAMLFSWVWRPTLIINIVGLVLFQVPRFCCQTEGLLHGSAAAAGLTALCQLGVGIYFLVDFRWWRTRTQECEPFLLRSYREYGGYDREYGHVPQDCREEVWGTIAIVCAVLWTAAFFGCLVHFIRTGRHAKWEKRHWVTIAIVCAVLWAAAFGCLVYFVRSGRHAKWEKKHSGDSTNNVEEVELKAAAPVVAYEAVVVTEPVSKVDDV
jgi:hypothetical protein